MPYDDIPTNKIYSDMIDATNIFQSCSNDPFFAGTAKIRDSKARNLNALVTKKKQSEQTLLTCSQCGMGLDTSQILQMLT